MLQKHIESYPTFIVNKNIVLNITTKNYPSVPFIILNCNLNWFSENEVEYSNLSSDKIKLWWDDGA